MLCEGGASWLSEKNIGSGDDAPADYELMVLHTRDVRRVKQCQSNLPNNRSHYVGWRVRCTRGCSAARAQCEDRGVSSSQQSEPPVTVSHTGPSDSAGPGSEPPPSTVFRIPVLALAGVVLFLFGATFPVAGNPALFGWTLIFPVLAAYAVLRLRTTVTPDTLRARSMVQIRTVAWADVTGLSFPRLRWARATLADGSQVPLPAITIDDLPKLSRASNGAVPDPTPPPAETEPAEPEPTESEPTDEPESDGGAESVASDPTPPK